MSLPAPYYQDDLVTLYHGDCLELMPLIEADVLVTDPPYGYEYYSRRSASKKQQPIHNDDSIALRDEVLREWCDRPAVVFGSWKRKRPERITNMLIWNKGAFPGMGDLYAPWGTSHEEIYVMGTWPRRLGGRAASVLTHKPPPPGANAGRAHPNEKPTALIRDLIGKCPPGTILDPFAGSGSTLRAAKDLGRKAIGIEIDERWLDGAVRKLAQDNLFAGGVDA